MTHLGDFEVLLYHSQFLRLLLAKLRNS